MIEGERTGRALIGIVGPTGTGKSAVAMAIAEGEGGEIVSVDSAQVFRGLDVGTAKPTRDEQRRVRHHVIDVIDPDIQWSAADFARAADAAIQDIERRGRIPILCGGTGLWLRALVHGIFEAPPINPEIRAEIRQALVERGAPEMHRELADVDPSAASRIMPQDAQRIGRALEIWRQTGTPISELQRRHGFKEERYRLSAIAIRIPGDDLASALNQRARHMFESGILEETSTCLARGLSSSAPGLSAIGYREAVAHLLGQTSLEEAIRATQSATRRYAKRQRSWFSSIPTVDWVEQEEAVDALRRAHLSGPPRA